MAAEAKFQLMGVRELHALLWAADAISSVPCPADCIDGVILEEEVDEGEWAVSECEWCAMKEYVRDAAGYEVEDQKSTYPPCTHTHPDGSQCGASPVGGSGICRGGDTLEFLDGWCADHLPDDEPRWRESAEPHTGTGPDWCNYCSHRWGDHGDLTTGGEVGCVLAGCDCRWAPPITRPCAHESVEACTCGTGELDLLYRKLQELLNIVRGLRADRNHVMGPDKTVRD